MNAVPGGGPTIPPVSVGATRRTTSILITPHGSWANGQGVIATGRDLRRSDGDVRTTDEQFSFDLDAAGLIVPRAGGHTLPEELRGLSAQRGLRKTVARLRAELGDRGDDAFGPVGGLTDTLLDDVVGTCLASGYARLYEGSAQADGGRLPSLMRLTCVGFSTMDRRGEQFDVPAYFATKAPSVEFVTADPLVWHDEPPVSPGSFRRRRMLQVAPMEDRRTAVTGYFRDTFVRPDGVEVVVHEYGLVAALSGDPLVLDTVEAVPGNLPLEHCPLAARSALALGGLPVSQIEPTVRRAMAGPTGCTHLNDELRSLRLVPALLEPDVPRRQMRTYPPSTDSV